MRFICKREAEEFFNDIEEKLESYLKYALRLKYLSTYDIVHYKECLE